MGTVTIHSHTTKNPLTMIGEFAGICTGANTQDVYKNYKRGLECLTSNHGRTFEYPDVYMTLDGYSAKVVREWYTHVGGLPTRLQKSTRYTNPIDFKFVTPPSIASNIEASLIYGNAMCDIERGVRKLLDAGVPREDASMLLPLGMTTTVVCKHNLRNLIDMSHQRLCSRAYWEYRELFHDVMQALREYSPEWKTLVNGWFRCKCEVSGFCEEKNSCGSKPMREDSECR